MSGIQMVCQVTRLYHFNIRHPYCPVFRCLVFRWLLYNQLWSFFKVCQLLNSVLDISPTSNLIDTRGQSSFVDFSPMSIVASSDDETDASTNVKTSTSTIKNRKRKPDDDESAKMIKRQLTGLISMETFGLFIFFFVVTIFPVHVRVSSPFDPIIGSYLEERLPHTCS